jgi:hypothetical protein
LRADHPELSAKARVARSPSTRKSDLAEDLFADVTGLPDEERIALFT